MSNLLSEAVENVNSDELKTRETNEVEIGSCESVNDDSEAVVASGDGAASQPSTLSKRALKRMKNHERWLELKALKRKDEKLKRKRKFVEARERGDIRPSRKALKRNAMQNSNCKIRVVLDCSFDEYMAEKDVRHLVQQIQHSYSANRRADNPLQFYVCGVMGKTQTRLEEIGDYKGWDVNFQPETYSDMFKKEEIVYLSSDSPNILNDLSDDKVYVIGGLVDHNHHKGLCHKLAEEKGMSHAQLPISECIDMKTRKVLTINHVFEILLRYTESHDWREAFFKVLPQRKGVKPKDDKTENRNVESEDKCEDKTETMNTSIDNEDKNHSASSSSDKNPENNVPQDTVASLNKVSRTSTDACDSKDHSTAVPHGDGMVLEKGEEDKSQKSVKLEESENTSELSESKATTS